MNGCRIHGAVELPCHVCLVNERDQLRARVEASKLDLSDRIAEVAKLRAEVAALRERAEKAEANVAQADLCIAGHKNQESADAYRIAALDEVGKLVLIRERERDTARALLDRADAAFFEMKRRAEVAEADAERLRGTLGIIRSAAHSALNNADRVWLLANDALGELRSAHATPNQEESKG